MSVYNTIKSELQPYFRYATPENPSKIINDVHLAYQNCVSCNVKRFTEEQMPYLLLGTDTFFCDPCFAKVANLVKKYDKRNPSEEYNIFAKIWHAYFDGKTP